MAVTADLNAALAMLEAAVDAFSPPLTLAPQGLEEIDLGAPAPSAPAAGIAGIDDALDPPIERLRASLGDL